MPRPPIDIVGQRFGRLIPVRFHATLGWECRCDCGNTKVVRGDHLRDGHIKSCGCLGGPRELHGRSYDPAYRSWQQMKRRCNVPRCPKYPNYGGRGIRLHFESFEEFFAEVGPRPPGTSIDRIDNDGHYAPGNVRWATPLMQSRNRRTVRKWTVADIQKLITLREGGMIFSEIGKQFGISKKSTIRNYRRFKAAA